jgi:hypothetical protein
MNRVWTEEELDILRRDRELKVPVPVTAAKLGRPVPATYARARLIGTLVQPHQSWDEASVARLRELVCADPPMTDKRIAAELNRTVTQIRWKMQDLGLIGVRDLSKLAKITAAGMARPKTAEHSSAGSLPSKPVPRSKPSRQPVPEKSATLARHVAAAPVVPRTSDTKAALECAIKTLETAMADRLKSSIAETEAGMIKAARAAIAEKGRIDQRLVVRVKRVAEAEVRRLATEQALAEAERTAAKSKRQEVGGRKVEAEAKRQAEMAARQSRHLKTRAGQPPERAKIAPSAPVGNPKPVEKKVNLSAVQGMSRDAAPRPAPQPAAPPVSKIVVLETPAERPVEADQAATHVSGRGGWKSARRDPARALAQAKAKAKPANRAEAVDLAQAAQAAIERFIAERGVTRTESGGIKAVVSRLQARGYIVVRDESGWTIDQRHRVSSESDLMAFAEARGITLSAAA